MKAFRHRFFAYLISISLLGSYSAPALAFEKSEKAELIVEKPDSAEVKSLEKKVSSKNSSDIKKVDRSTRNSSYTFIFYLVAMIVKAFSFSPHR